MLEAGCGVWCVVHTCITDSSPKSHQCSLRCESVMESCSLLHTARLNTEETYRGKALKKKFGRCSLCVASVTLVTAPSLTVKILSALKVLKPCRTSTTWGALSTPPSPPPALTTSPASALTPFPAVRTCSLSCPILELLLVLLLLVLVLLLLLLLLRSLSPVLVLLLLLVLYKHLILGLRAGAVAVARGFNITRAVLPNRHCLRGTVLHGRAMVADMKGRKHPPAPCCVCVVRKAYKLQQDDDDTPCG